jgi:hypothetical protein
MGNPGPFEAILANFSESRSIKTFQSINLMLVVINLHNHLNIRNLAVAENKTKYHARDFSPWNHFSTMLFGKRTGQNSLRGIEAGLASQLHTLYYSGVKSVFRSTLSNTNKHRSYEFLKKLSEWMLSKVTSGKFHVQKKSSSDTFKNLNIEEGE